VYDRRKITTSEKDKLYSSFLAVIDERNNFSKILNYPITRKISYSRPTIVRAVSLRGALLCRDWFFGRRRADFGTKGNEKLILQTLPSEFGGSVIAFGWVVRPAFYDEVNFPAIDLAVICVIRELQEYFFSDNKVSPLLSRKVFFDNLAVSTSKVVEGVGEV